MRLLRDHRKGKCRRRAAGKASLFGPLQRKCKVFTVSIPDALIPIIRHNVKPDSIVYNDTFRFCDTFRYKLLDSVVKQGVAGLEERRVKIPLVFWTCRNNVISVNV